MFNKIKFFFILGIILQNYSVCNAQSTNLSRVQLKNNQIYIGEILELHEDSFIKLSINNKLTMYIEFRNIKSISPEFINLKPIKTKSILSDSGHYIDYKFGFFIGNSNSFEFEGGLHLSVAYGKYYNRFLKYGLGIGINSYSPTGWGTQANVVPVFAEIGGFIKPSHSSLFYKSEIGYGKLLDQIKYDNSSKGGMYLNFAIGVKFAMDKNNSFYFGTGYRLQHLKSLKWQSTSWNGNSLYYDLDIWLKRADFIFGFEF